MNGIAPAPQSTELRGVGTNDVEPTEVEVPESYRPNLVCPMSSGPRGDELTDDQELCNTRVDREGR